MVSDGNKGSHQHMGRTGSHQLDEVAPRNRQTLFCDKLRQITVDYGSNSSLPLSPGRIIQFLWSCDLLLPSSAQSILASPLALSVATLTNECGQKGPRPVPGGYLKRNDRLLLVLTLPPTAKRKACSRDLLPYQFGTQNGAPWSPAGPNRATSE